jgi:NitT/TauT family transport system substrate-binding protein
MIRKSCAFALAAALATAAPSAGLAEQNAKTSIRLSLNPLVYAHLPVMMAVDKGYFVQEGIEPIVTKYTGSAVTQMPLLARGDLDITGVVGGPALFNQYADGFGIKLIAANEATHDGWNDTTWVIVRKDLWDSGAIRSITDLKGRAVDAGPEGSPVNFLLNQVLKKAGLTRADVKYSTRAVSPPDWIAGFRNNAFDAVSAVEPVVTQIVEQGYGVRLTSPREIMPWWQGPTSAPRKNSCNRTARPQCASSKLFSAAPKTSSVPARAGRPRSWRSSIIGAASRSGTYRRSRARLMSANLAGSISNL